jgi:hypothetical protein
MAQYEESPHHEARPDLVWLIVAISCSIAFAALVLVDVSSSFRVAAAINVSVGVALVVVWIGFFNARTRLHLAHRFDRLEAKRDDDWTDGFVEGRRRGGVGPAAR